MCRLVVIAVKSKRGPDADVIRRCRMQYAQQPLEGRRGQSRGPDVKSICSRTQTSAMKTAQMALVIICHDSPAVIVSSGVAVFAVAQFVVAKVISYKKMCSVCHRDVQ